ncbi:hypothetical protein E2C01_031935 [Portunus trituberculatus]|uniref:Uncharacterized protein n=1 Tax=Portunus trituberculatus TaxID=210409 RepID=A0A5B7EZI8_PORTR|nr:hypothetical protein [Portunus trituberculatus]
MDVRHVVGRFAVVITTTTTTTTIIIIIIIIIRTVSDPSCVLAIFQNPGVLESKHFYPLAFGDSWIN